MTQRTCCVSSRPAPHLADRSLSKLSSRSKFTKRVARLSRRALAALLLVSGAGLGTPGHTASGHDHLPDTADAVQSVAIPAAVPASLLFPARLEGDAMLLQWLQSADAAQAACADANQTVDLTTSEASILAPAIRPITVAPPQDQGATSNIDSVESSRATAANQWGDYCDLQDLLAWGSQAKSWVSPLAGVATAITPIATENANAISRSITRGLSDLSCEEPIDIVASDVVADQPASAGDESEIDWLAVEFAAVKAVAGSVVTENDSATDADGNEPDFETDSPVINASVENETADSVASDAPEFNSMALVGGGAIVASIPEAYMPYDLSPEDAIAMRMYPLGGSPIDYLGARRTGMYSPLKPGSVSDTWQQVIEESVVVSTPGATVPAATDVASENVSEQTETPAQPIVEVIPQLQGIAALAQSAIEAVQPDSQWRQQLGPWTLGAELGEMAGVGLHAADTTLGDLAARLASVWQPAPRPAIPVQPAERLVAQAELMPPQAVEGADRILQIELACQAAINVVRAQGSRLSDNGDGAVDEVAAAGPAIDKAATQEEITRAEAVATACDFAAASLERLAMSLRRAGDSVVRQAKANAGAEPMLRR